LSTVDRGGTIGAMPDAVRDSSGGRFPCPCCGYRTLPGRSPYFARSGASEQRWHDRVRSPRADEGPPEPWMETRTTLGDPA